MPGGRAAPKGGEAILGEGVSVRGEEVLAVLLQVVIKGGETILGEGVFVRGEEALLGEEFFFE